MALAIAGVLMTLSVGVLSRVGRKDALESTQLAVRALLRRAHNAAREERHQVVVELDARASELRAHQKVGITRFRFERPRPLTLPLGEAPPSATGADGPPAGFESDGAKGFLLSCERGEVDLGRTGQGALFRYADDDGAAWAWVEDRPVLSPIEGVYVSCWVYLGRLDEQLSERPSRGRPTARQEEDYARAGDPPREGPARVHGYSPTDPPVFYALRKGRAYSLAVTAAYEVELAFSGPDADGIETTWISRTRPGTLRPYRWTRLALSFDGREARIAVDGIARVHLPLTGHDRLPARLVRDRAPLALSDPHPDRAFYGKLDEVEVAAITRAQRVLIPREVALVAPVAEVAFDPLGQLDPSRHAEPVVLYLADDEGAFDLVSGGAAAPEDAGGAPGTRTRDPESSVDAGPEGSERQHVLLGRARFAKFLETLPGLDPNRVRRVVIERTGLVTE